jgi:hypothetical protein
MGGIADLIGTLLGGGQKPQPVVYQMPTPASEITQEMADTSSDDGARRARLASQVNNPYIYTSPLGALGKPQRPTTQSPLLGGK